MLKSFKYSNQIVVNEIQSLTILKKQISKTLKQTLCVNLYNTERETGIFIQDSATWINSN